MDLFPNNQTPGVANTPGVWLLPRIKGSVQVLRLVCRWCAAVSASHMSTVCARCFSRDNRARLRIYGNATAIGEVNVPNRGAGLIAKPAVVYGVAGASFEGSRFGLRLSYCSCSGLLLGGWGGLGRALLGRGAV